MDTLLPMTAVSPAPQTHFHAECSLFGPGQVLLKQDLFGVKNNNWELVKVQTHSAFALHVCMSKQIYVAGPMTAGNLNTAPMTTPVAWSSKRPLPSVAAGWMSTAKTSLRATQRP